MSIIDELQRRHIAIDAGGGQLFIPRESATRLLDTIDGQRRRQYNLRARFPSLQSVTRDVGQNDYGFYDRLAQGKVDGYKTSGVLIKPIISKKTSWVMGTPPEIRGADAYTSAWATNWIKRHHAKLMRAYELASRLGDFYVVVNSDLSLTVVPPHVVRPLVDPDDYTRFTGWEIRDTTYHPTEIGLRQTKVEIYTAVERYIAITQSQGNRRVMRFRNPTGLVPFVHIPNNLGSNEVFGHPEAEPLLTVLAMYDDIISAAYTGNLMQGRPTAVFETDSTVEQLTKFINEFGTSTTTTASDGTTETYKEYVMDSDRVVFTASGMKFKYESPGKFADETAILLELLFYLIVQHSELPEFVFGTAVQSSKASVETQMPVFLAWAEKNQAACQDWLTQLVQVGMGIQALSDFRIQPQMDFDIVWEKVVAGDVKHGEDAVQVVPDETPEEMREARYDDINFSPPEGVRSAAKRGLELRSEHGRGGTDVGIARARDLSNGENMTPDTIRRMFSFFSRHSAYKKNHTTKPPSNSYISWLLWGGDAGFAWARKVKKQMDARDNKKEAV